MRYASEHLALQNQHCHVPIEHLALQNQHGYVPIPKAYGPLKRIYMQCSKGNVNTGYIFGYHFITYIEAVLTCVLIIELWGSGPANVSLENLLELEGKLILCT